MPGAIEDLTRDAMRHQFEVNLFGLQELTNKLIPVFRAAGLRTYREYQLGGGADFPAVHGDLFRLQVCPRSGQRCPAGGVFAGSIGVSLVEPGPIETRFSTNCAARAKGNWTRNDPGSVGLSGNILTSAATEGWAKTVSVFRRRPWPKRLLHALESPRPKIRYCVTIPAYFGDWAARFMPAGLIDRMMIAKVKKRYGLSVDSGPNTPDSGNDNQIGIEIPN